MMKEILYILLDNFTMTKRNKYNDKMKKLLCPLFLLVAGVQFAQAQDLSKFKTINDSVYQTVTEYNTGNRYQKDAILFIDIVADTHPYYIKEERRAEWFAKKQTLL